MKGKVMKNVFKKLACLAIPFLLLGCAGAAGSSEGEQSSEAGEQHRWDTAWAYDENNHWHICKDKTCQEVSDLGPHVMGDPQEIDPSKLSGKAQYAFATPKIQKCQTCDYYKIVDGTNILPELRFTFTDKNAKGEPQEVNFATIATKSDFSRPEVEGTFALSNCANKNFEFSNISGTMKVRGNQTAGWSKKAFRIKFKTKRPMLGLNGGKEFKKWVLLADAKDTTLIRSAAGLYLSKEVCKGDDQVWVCDYTPVTVYLNGEYWGYYYLAEQKEVKSGRIRLNEVDEGYDDVDIGYCFELDHYADSAGNRDEASEIAKGVDGDPTFRIKYLPELKQGRPSGPLAVGQVCTYTMLSDITDGPTDAHVQADYSSVNTSNGIPNNNATKTSNSNQLSFIRDRVEASYQVLYYAAMNKQAKEINKNNEVVNSSKTVQQVMEQHFDLDAWVDGYIINGYSCPPDLGYSSFYMSYDNTPNGDKKLRFDCPWDFDSNFANRNNFYVNGETDTYVENTYNAWLYLLTKLDFFMNMVKAKWKTLMTNKVFENMIAMMKKYYADYDAEIRRNHYKWPQNDAAHQPPNNFDEIREPFKDPANYKEAEAETLSWCAKRANYLDKKWGTGTAKITA